MLGSKITAGTRVLIIQDCRPGAKATGALGIYEGNFPLSVALGYQPEGSADTEWLDHEGDYEEYKSGALLLDDGRKANEVFLEWEPGKDHATPYFAMPVTNPRIRLDDGTVIWGAECWWQPANESTLEEAQKELQSHKDFLRVFFAPEEPKEQ